MKKICIIVFICFIIVLEAFGDGIIKGKVVNVKGESLTGAVVTLKSKYSIKTITDLNGNYSLMIPDSGTANTALVISREGYRTKVEFLHPLTGRENIIVRNIVMLVSPDKPKEAKDRAKESANKVIDLDSLKKYSSSAIDFVDNEDLRNYGDIDISETVSDMPGIATNGNYINIRGFGDRYIQKTINGSVIPTLDPLTNNINLDIFSATLVDHVIVTKTASPDLQSDWAGGHLSINTKTPADKFTVNVESGIGLNSQTTFKDIISSQGSSTDWLGYDNSFREHDQSSFVQLRPYPLSQEQELFALGLGPYFNSLGITSGSQWNQSYFILGLVQLGLLGKAQINDPRAVAAAEYNYDHGPYHAEAFDIYNAAAIKSNKSFPDTWQTITRKAAPDLYQSFSISNQTTLFGRPLGFFVGLQYSSFTQYDPNARLYDFPEGHPDITSGVITNNDTARIDQSIETHAWSALLNLNYKLNRNNSISLLFMPNVIGTNTARSDIRSLSPTFDEIYQYYESREQRVYQLKTEHYIPLHNKSNQGLKVEFNASYTLGNNTAPDLTDVELPTGLYKNQPDLSASRIYRYLTENVLDFRLSAELPVGKQVPGLSRKIKFGCEYLRNDNRSDQYVYNVSEENDSWFVQGHGLEDPFSLDKFDIKSYVYSGIPINTVQKYYYYLAYPYNHTLGYSMVKSGYVMGDYAVNSRLRFSGGVRVEQTNMFWDVDLFDSLGLPANDPRRNSALSTLPNNPVNIASLNYLPSADLIYTLRNEQLSNSYIPSAILLRLNFSQSIARPTLREIANSTTYDYEFQTKVEGNPDLKLAEINNYDLRCEFYLNSKDYFSVSGFYKDVRNDIELANFGAFGFTWLNNPNRAYVRGIEITGVKKISKHFELEGNLTFEASHTQFEKYYQLPSGGYFDGGQADHPMFGQVPYDISALISYTSEKAGLLSSLIYNVQGPCIVTEGGGYGYADIYEMPRNQFDVMVLKRITKHFSIRLKVKDILDTPIRLSYKFPEGYILDYSDYRYGTNYIFSIIYKL